MHMHEPHVLLLWLRMMIANLSSAAVRMVMMSLKHSREDACAYEPHVLLCWLRMMIVNLSSAAMRTVHDDSH